MDKQDQTPFAWATVIDGALSSLSSTKIAAQIRAQILRDENKGRDFNIAVIPLYTNPSDTPQEIA